MSTPSKSWAAFQFEWAYKDRLYLVDVAIDGPTALDYRMLKVLELVGDDEDREIDWVGTVRWERLLEETYPRVVDYLQAMERDNG